MEGKVQLQNTLSNLFENSRTFRLSSRFLRKHFFCDVSHFGGEGKPWLTEPMSNTGHSVDVQEHGPAAARIWWRTLYELNREPQIGLDFDHWETTNQKPLVGLLPTFAEMDERVAQSATQSSHVEGIYSSNLSAAKSTKYALCYAIGGCDSRNNGYKGFMYNILVSASILREEGSKVDVVAFFQMSYKSGATALPVRDVRWLETMGVKIEYTIHRPRTKVSTELLCRNSASLH